MIALIFAAGRTSDAEAGQDRLLLDYVITTAANDARAAYNVSLHDSQRFERAIPASLAGHVAALLRNLQASQPQQPPQGFLSDLQLRTEPQRTLSDTDDHRSIPQNRSSSDVQVPTEARTEQMDSIL